MRGKIIIYTNETCPYCKQIKEKFNEKNIEFENRITKDYTEEWQSVTNLTGMPTVPTVKYNGEYFVPGRDFPNPDRLIDIFIAKTQVLVHIKDIWANIPLNGQITFSQLKNHLLNQRVSKQKNLKKELKKVGKIKEKIISKKWRDNEKRKLPYLKEIFLEIQADLKENPDHLPFWEAFVKDAQNSQNHVLRF